MTKLNDKTADNSKAKASIKPAGGAGKVVPTTSGVKDSKQPLKTNSDTKVVIERFVADLTDMEVKKQLILEEIKDLKNDYKEEGIPVALITKLFKKTLNDKKKTDSERFEEETITEWLAESKIVDEACLKLTK